MKHLQARFHKASVLTRSGCALMLVGLVTFVYSPVVINLCSGSSSCQLQSWEKSLLTFFASTGLWLAMLGITCIIANWVYRGVIWALESPLCKFNRHLGTPDDPGCNCAWHRALRD